MYKRIMAAIDDRFAASRVLEAAIESARQHGAKLALCHALDETSYARLDAAIMLDRPTGEIGADPKGRASAFVERAATIARAADVDVEVMIVESEFGLAAQMLADAAAQWRADLLVVGTHSRSGVERLFVGSVAEELVRKATTSLLLVRRN